MRRRGTFVAFIAFTALVAVTAVTVAQGGGKPATGNPTPGTAQPDRPNVAKRVTFVDCLQRVARSGGPAPATAVEANIPSNERFELTNVEPAQRALSGTAPPADGQTSSASSKVFRVEEDKGRLDLNQVLAKLAEEGITRCLVEGGPIVASSLVAGNLVDEAILVRGEKTIGETGIDPLDGMPLEAMTGRLTLRGSERLATDTIENFVRG